MAKPVAAAAKPAPKAVAPKAVVKPVEAPIVVTRRADFKVGDHVVYPAHGVGRIVSIEEQVVAGHTLELFVITSRRTR